MNRHKEKPACYRDGPHDPLPVTYRLGPNDSILSFTPLRPIVESPCGAHGAPANLEMMRSLTPGCEGCDKMLIEQEELKL